MNKTECFKKSLDCIRFLPVGLLRDTLSRYTCREYKLKTYDSFDHFYCKKKILICHLRAGRASTCDHWALHWLYIQFSYNFQSFFFFGFFFCFFWDRVYYYVVQAVLELAMYVDQAGLKPRSTCLCVPRPRTKGVYPPSLSYTIYLVYNFSSQMVSSFLPTQFYVLSPLKKKIKITNQ